MNEHRLSSVAEALALVDDVVSTLIGPMAITGTIHDLRKGTAWGRAEVVSHAGPTITARLPVAIPPHVMDGIGEVIGAHVTITGRFTTHPLYGPLQFEADAITVVDPIAAPVAAARAFISELESSGVIGANRRLALCGRPERIGLIAPLRGGAAGADFVHRLAASGTDIAVITEHVAMGGPTAVDELVGALARLPGHAIDVIVIVRGGGARSELAAFDHPLVVEAIVTAPVPVITGIGHATDSMLADRVAHTSLPTPSAAATWLIDRRQADQRTALVESAHIKAAEAAQLHTAARLQTQRAHTAQHRARRLVIAAAAAIVLAAIAIPIFLVALLVNAGA